MAAPIALVQHEVASRGVLVSLGRSPSAGCFRVAQRLLVVLLTFACTLTNAEPPSRVDNAFVSPSRMQRLDHFLQEATATSGYVGAVAVVSINGKTVYSAAHGHRDLARTQTLKSDAIFRIYSMTKTVTTVAVLMLMEEGRLSLDDPVSKFLPEFANLQVFDSGSVDAPVLRAPKTALTLHHLLTHTAGFATGGVGAEAATLLLQRADLEHSRDLAQFAQRLSSVPLAIDPGTRFRYDGTQIELLARVVEVVSGERFDQFLRERIFLPLRMVDTGFSVPAGQRDRVIDLTHIGNDGVLAIDASPSAQQPGIALRPYSSGAGGLYSTAPDFLRFCRMLLDGGNLDGVALLGRKTVEQMMVNHLGFLDPPVTQFSPAEGFGLGGSVLLDPALRGRLGSVGQFGWSGAASTYFSIDPKEHLISILLLQHLPNDADNDLPKLSTPFYNLVYQALQ